MIFDLTILLRIIQHKKKKKNDNPYTGDAIGFLGLFLIILILRAAIWIIYPIVNYSEISLSEIVNTSIYGLFNLYIFIKLLRMRGDGVTMYIFYSVCELLLCGLLLMSNLPYALNGFYSENGVMVLTIITGVTLAYLLISRQVRTYYPIKSRKLTFVDYIVCIVYLLSLLL